MDADKELKARLQWAGEELAAGRVTARQAGRLQAGALLVYAQCALDLAASLLAPADALLDAVSDLDRGRIDPMLIPRKRPGTSVTGNPKGARPPKYGHAETENFCQAAALASALVYHGAMLLAEAESYVAAETARRGRDLAAAKIHQFRNQHTSPTAALDACQRAATALDDRLARGEAPVSPPATDATAWAEQAAQSAWRAPLAVMPQAVPVPAAARPAVTAEASIRRAYQEKAELVESWYTIFRTEAIGVSALDATFLAVAQALNGDPTLERVPESLEIAAIYRRSDEAAAHQSG